MSGDTATLSELIVQAESILKQIKKHPDYQQISYSPDFTIIDAIAALAELSSEILP